MSLQAEIGGRSQSCHSLQSGSRREDLDVKPFDLFDNVQIGLPIRSV
jgi:hypothetical protein